MNNKSEYLLRAIISPTPPPTSRPTITIRRKLGVNLHYVDNYFIPTVRCSKNFDPTAINDGKGI